MSLFCYLIIFLSTATLSLNFSSKTTQCSNNLIIEDGSVYVVQYVLTLLFNLSCCCRQAKAELRTATAKVDEMTKLLQNVQDQMQRRVREDKKNASYKNYIAEEKWFSISWEWCRQRTCVLRLFGCSAPILSLFVIVLDT